MPELYRSQLSRGERGAILREEIRGKRIGTKNQFLAKKGQFIFSRIDARNGAFVIVPTNLDDAVVSNDFPVFDVNKSIVNPSYFNYLINSKFLHEIFSTLSNGIRKRISIQ